MHFSPKLLCERYGRTHSHTLGYVALVSMFVAVCVVSVCCSMCQYVLQCVSVCVAVSTFLDTSLLRV